MVFFNYATMQMAAKIVYYGPGLCGKTTNLHVIYGRTAPNSRGEMVCLETETDRTLFFDLLPLDVGIIGGFKTRLQLYTVHGQVFYNTTRKLVLKGVDGIVFVADSQRPMLEPNRESLRNLRENLAEIGLSLESIPRVFQFNKRDLQNILSIDELNDTLNHDRSMEVYESSATNGTGVFETLKAISKLTLRSLRSRMTGGVKRPSVVASAPTPAPIPATAISSAALVVPALAAEGPRKNVFDSTITRLKRFKKDLDSGIYTPPPAGAISAGPFPEAGAAPQRPDESELSFGEIRPPDADAPPQPSMKRVRVHSNVDILSELEKLRKVATQRPTGRTGTVSALDRKPRSGAMSIDDLLSSTLNHKKDVVQTFDLAVPKDALAKSRRLKVGLSFADTGGGEVVPARTFDVDLGALSDVRKLLLSLKFNVQGE
jgi:signal recognition particle receptor subunit beta